MTETTQLETRPPTRRRLPLAVVAILAVLAVGAVAVAYLAFFTDSPERLTLSEQPATSAPATTSAAGAGDAAAAPAGSDIVGTWRAASGSEAGYRVREKLAALPAKSDASPSTASPGASPFPSTSGSPGTRASWWGGSAFP